MMFRQAECGNDDAVLGAQPSVEHSFDCFYRDQWDRIVLLITVLCSDRGVAEDLAQDTFLRAYRNRAALVEMDRPDLWLRRVALNLVRSRFRRLVVEARPLARTAARARVEEDRWSSPEVEKFWEVLRALPPRERAAAALFYVDDLSVAEVARLVGRAEGTVKAQLSSARRRIRSAMARAEEVDDAD
jgi:RNA polymerase sigma-70 factor, ECF subfamily